MLVRVAEQQIEHTLVILVAGELPATCQPSVGYAVDREDVQIDAAKIFQVHALDERGAGILHFAEG